MKFAPGSWSRKGGGPAADVPEHEGRARPRRRLKRQHDVIQKQEELLEERDVEENAGDRELDDDAGQRRGVSDALSCSR